MVLRRKVLICPSFLHIWLPDLSNVLQVFWRSFRVLLWTFAAFSLLFSPVFVPTFFRGILFSLCVKHKPLNTDGCSSLLRNTVYSSHLMSACYIGWNMDIVTASPLCFQNLMLTRIKTKPLQIRLCLPLPLHLDSYYMYSELHTLKLQHLIW